MTGFRGQDIVVREAIQAAANQLRIDADVAPIEIRRLAHYGDVLIQQVSRASTGSVPSSAASGLSRGRMCKRTRLS